MESHPSFSDITLDRSGSRYELLVKIASGGMATVYVGRLRGAVGFWRLVAIKRAHAHLLEKPLYKQMLVDEARLASRLHHPNVVAVLDVEELSGELRLVMDYVEGAALSELVARSHEAERRLPARIAVRIALDACAGLHAAHELCDENGARLGLVHRDVSPHNLLVGVDGVARLADFGIAKQSDSGVSTTTGTLKGKLAYMAPEYVEEARLDPRSDVFSLGVVVWEALANEKLFRGTNEVDTLRRVVAANAPRLSTVAPWVGTQLDEVLASALARLPEERFSTALAFGTALETAARKDDLIATPAEVGAYVRELVGASLDKRRDQVRERTAPIRSEPTVRVTKNPSAGVAQAGVDPPSIEEGAREASSVTLKQSSSTLDAALPTKSRWRAPVILAVAALGLGAGGALLLQGRGGGEPRAATSSAPVIASSAAVIAASAPVIASSASSTPIASAAAPVAVSASARPAAPPIGKPIKPKASVAPVADPGLAPNPY